MCAWVYFGELGCVCVLGSVLKNWDVYVCFGLFWRVGMCVCVCLGLFGELGCVYVCDWYSSLLQMKAFSDTFVTTNISK